MIQYQTEDEDTSENIIGYKNYLHIITLTM